MQRQRAGIPSHLCREFKEVAYYPIKVRIVLIDIYGHLPQQGIREQAILAPFFLSINPPRQVTMPVPLLAFFLLEKTPPSQRKAGK